MRSGAISRKRALSALITGDHIADELAEPCRRSTGVPNPAVNTALRRIGRTVLIQSTIAAEELLRRHARCRIDPLDPGGAKLELGDFPERIKRRVGEQVGRCLDKS